MSKEFLTLVLSIVKAWKKSNHKKDLLLYSRAKELNSRFNDDPNLAKKEFTFLFSQIEKNIIKDPELAWLSSSSVKIAVGGSSMKPEMKTSLDISDVWGKLLSLKSKLEDFDGVVKKFKLLFITLACECNANIAADEGIKKLLQSSSSTGVTDSKKAEPPSESKTGTENKLPVDMAALSTMFMPLALSIIKELPKLFEQYGSDEAQDDGLMGQLIKAAKEAKIDTVLKKIASSVDGKDTIDPTAIMNEVKASVDVDAITSVAKERLDATNDRIRDTIARQRGDTARIEAPIPDVPQYEPIRRGNE